jgi:hypothetical protein
VKLIAICPTFGRPECAANAVALWERQQGLQSANCELLVLDDGGDFLPCESAIGKWQLFVDSPRYPSLPAKFNTLCQLAENRGADWVMLWEDDDVYLRWHLETYLAAAQDLGDAGWLHPARVLVAMGNSPVHEEVGLGRFHAQWAFPVELWRRVSGYPEADPGFDLGFGARLSAHPRWWERASHAGLPPVCPYKLLGVPPSYVYRRGNAGFYHGSAYGTGFYQKVGRMVADRRRGGTSAPQVLVPRLDQHTAMVLAQMEVA